MLRFSSVRANDFRRNVMDERFYHTADHLLQTRQSAKGKLLFHTALRNHHEAIFKCSSWDFFSLKPVQLYRFLQ